MNLLLDSFWRAVAYCLHPRVIALSLLPLAIGVALALGLGWFYWEDAVAGVRSTLESWSLVDAGLKWVESMAGASFRSVLAPLLVVLLAAPVIVVVSVLLVALLMVPAIVKLVSSRRYPLLERKRGAGTLSSVAWSLGCTVLALVVMVVSLPLWFIPPLVLVLPPLIWGWLTYRVMSFDAMAEHASASERRQLMRQHRLPLLGIGVISGYLGAAPSLLWAVSAVTVIFAPFIIALSVWLYTLVFAFSALWFAHYVLAALHAMRQATPDAARPAGEVLKIDTTEVLPALDKPPTPPLAPLAGLTPKP